MAAFATIMSISCTKLKLQVTPNGCDDSKGMHLSVELWLVKGGHKRDYNYIYAHIMHGLNLLEEYKNKANILKVQNGTNYSCLVIQEKYRRVYSWHHYSDFSSREKHWKGKDYREFRNECYG